MGHLNSILCSRQCVISHPTNYPTHFSSYPVWVSRPLVQTDAETVTSTTDEEGGSKRTSSEDNAVKLAADAASYAWLRADSNGGGANEGEDGSTQSVVTASNHSGVDDDTSEDVNATSRSHAARVSVAIVEDIIREAVLRVSVAAANCDAYLNDDDNDGDGHDEDMPWDALPDALQ